MTEPLREFCPRCGAALDHDDMGWLPGYVARCPECRFEGAERPEARLIAWIRPRVTEVARRYSPAAWTWLLIGVVAYVAVRQHGVSPVPAGATLLAYTALVLWIDEHATEGGDQA